MEALRQEHITAERTMLEIARVALVDRTGVWDDAGHLKPFSEWTQDQRQLVEGLEIIIKNAAAGDNHTDTVHKLHLAKKPSALELLAKHFGLVTDRHEHNVTGELHVRLVDRISAARKRLGPASDV